MIYIHSNQDSLDTMLITIFGCMFFYCLRMALSVYIRARQYGCPTSQKIVIYLNILQSISSFVVCYYIVLRHAMPWVANCDFNKTLSITCLTICTGCITGILVIFVFQSAVCARRERILLGLGSLAIAATMGISSMGYFALEYTTTPNNSCILNARHKGWVYMKLIIDLTTNLGLSWAYLNVLKGIMQDTGMPVYRALFRDGMIGRFLVLFSNIICAVLVATDCATRWTAEIYVIDGKYPIDDLASLTPYVYL
jgi:hypothetical protein